MNINISSTDLKNIRLLLVSILLFSNMNLVSANLLASEAPNLTVNDLSLLFPLRVVDQLPKPMDFLSAKQLEELELALESNNACIVSLRIDPDSPLISIFNGSGNSEVNSVSAIVKIPSLRIIIQACDNKGGSAVHVFYTFTEAELEKLIVDSVLLREEASIVLDTETLKPRYDLIENPDYMNKLAMLLNSMLTQNKKIHRIASRKVFKIKEWAFRAVRVTWDHTGQENHTPERIPNIHHVETLGDSFQQTFLFDSDPNESQFLTDAYHQSMIDLQESNKEGTPTSGQINMRGFLAFPFPVHGPVYRFDRKPFKLGVSSLLKRDGQDIGADPNIVNPGNTDCLSCHVEPSLFLAGSLHEEDVNTTHFAWFRGDTPTISNLVVNDTQRIFDCYSEKINLKLREIRQER